MCERCCDARQREGTRPAGRTRSSAAAAESEPALPRSEAEFSAKLTETLKIRENAKGGCAIIASESATTTYDAEGDAPYRREPHISLRQWEASPAPPEAWQGVLLCLTLTASS